MQIIFPQKWRAVKCLDFLNERDIVFGYSRSLTGLQGFAVSAFPGEKLRWIWHSKEDLNY